MHRLLRSIISGIALVASAAQRGVAQGSELHTGSRVRISFPADTGKRLVHYVGRLATLHGDTARIITSGDSLKTLILQPDTKLERWTGSHRNAVAGLFAGLFVGAIVGAGQSSGEDPNIASAGLGFLGALVGLAVGIAVRTDTWKVVDRQGISVGVSPAGVGLRMNVMLGRNSRRAP